MQVLLYLCQAKQAVVSAEMMIQDCWPNQFFSDNPVHKCIARLRKALKDDAKQPKYIKTIPKKGYAIVQDILELETQTSVIKNYWHNGPPYLAFDSYQQKHQAIMFGRSKATSEIKQMIDQIDYQNNSLIMLLGPHSVGKTSLLDAQIIPHLKAPKRPYKNDYELFLKFTISNYEQEDEKQRLLDALTEQTATTVESLMLYSAETKTKQVVFIDQLERLLVKDSTEQVELFLAFLESLLKSQKYLIFLSMNHEYYADLMQFSTFQLVKKHALVYDLLPPNTEELRDIIRKPVFTSGLSFEYDKQKFESLDSLLLVDAMKLNHALPVISYAMRELCINKNKYHELTYAAYQEMGGFFGVISKKFDKIFDASQQSEQQAFTEKLHHLIKQDPKNKRQLYCADTPIDRFKSPQLNRLLKQLLSANLLKVTVMAEQTYIAIVHEALLTQCEVFKNWVAENRLKLSHMAEIDVMHTHWLDNNESTDYLVKNPFILEFADEMDLDSSKSLFIQQSVKKIRKTKTIKKLAVGSLVLMLMMTVSLLFRLDHSNQRLSDANIRAEALNVFLMDDLKSKLKPLGQLKLLEMISLQIIDYYQFQSSHSTASFLTAESSNHVINALNTLGEVKIKSGHHDEAMAVLEEAFEKAETSLSENGDHSQTLFHLSQTKYWIGYIHFLNKAWPLTKQNWSSYLVTIEKLMVLEPDNLEWKLEHSYALNNLGTLSLKMNQLSVASEYINQSAQIKKSLVELQPTNDQYIAELADTISWQANLLYKNNDFVGANQLYQESLDLSLQLQQMNPLDSNWTYRFALAHYRTGKSDYDLGRLDLARVHFDASKEILVELIAHDELNHKWLRTLINNHIYLAKVHYHLSLYDDAMIHANQGIHHYQSYSTEHKQLNTQIKQYLKLTAISSLVLAEVGQTKSAIMQYLEAYESVTKSGGESPLTQLEEAYHFYILYQLYQKNNTSDAALSAFNQAKAKVSNALTTEAVSTAEKALYLLINQIENQPIFEGQFIPIMRELELMHFKNPDFFNHEKPS